MWGENKEDLVWPHTWSLFFITCIRWVQFLCIFQNQYHALKVEFTLLALTQFQLFFLTRACIVCKTFKIIAKNEYLQFLWWSSFRCVPTITNIRWWPSFFLMPQFDDDMVVWPTTSILHVIFIFSFFWCPLGRCSWFLFLLQWGSFCLF